MICLSLTIFAAQASAQGTQIGDPIPLDLLIEQLGSFDVEDKRFSGFQYNATGDMPPADMVDLIPLVDLDGNYGFRMVGGFGDDPATTDNASAALLTYMVEVIDPNRLIVDAHLAGNPSITGGDGQASVTETFLPLGANDEFTMNIFDNSPGTARLIDWTDFTAFGAMGHRKINVQKSLTALAIGPNSDATIGFVDQTFSQAIIPEPASVCLMMLGLVGLTYLRTRQ